MYGSVSGNTRSLMKPAGNPLLRINAGLTDLPAPPSFEAE